MECLSLDVIASGFSVGGNQNNPRQRSVAIQETFGLLRRFTPRNDIRLKCAVGRFMRLT